MAKVNLKTFHKGIHCDDNKHITRDKPIEKMPLVDDYFVSLSQHIGAPSVAVVEKGDTVNEGQLIAKEGGNVSANIFSPVCGQVIGTEQRLNKFGVPANYIHIKRSEGQVATLPDIDKRDAIAIKERIALAGIVGLGGAGFPTHIKISPKKPVDTLIINAAECEPYLTCDYRLMIETTDDIITGAKLLAKSLNVSKIIVGIEENKLEAYQLLQKYSDIKTVLLKKKYPQGGEKQLIFAVSGRKVPAKGLPMDVGVVVQNVATCKAVFDACIKNKPLYERVITVSGLGVNNPKNLLVRVGTPYAKILEYCGGIKDETVKLISGGPMMGVALIDTTGVVSKTDSGLIAMTEEEASLVQPSPCISCGRCAASCPMNLMPMYIDFYTQAGDYTTSIKYGVEHCIECGCCSYVCPAKRALVQSIKLCKAKLKEKN